MQVVLDILMKKRGSRLSIAPPVGEEWNTTFLEQFLFAVQQNKLILLYQKTKI